MVLRLFALWRRRERSDGDGSKDLDRVVDARDGENGQVRMHCHNVYHARVSVPDAFDLGRQLVPHELVTIVRARDDIIVGAASEGDILGSLPVAMPSYADRG